MDSQPRAPQPAAGWRSLIQRLSLQQVLRVAGACLVTAVLCRVPLSYVESLTYDFRMRFRPDPKPSGQIELIVVRSNTIKKFKGMPTFGAHAEVLKKLRKVQPTQVIYIRTLAPLKSDIPGAKSFLTGTAKEKEEFNQAAQALPFFAMQTDEMAQTGEAGKLVLLPPFQNLTVLSGPKSADRNLFAKDGVTRRQLITYQDQLLMHAQIAQTKNPGLLRGGKDISSVRGLFDLFDSQQVYVDFVKQGSFSQTDFEDVFEDKVNLEKFRDKIVLIGDDTGEQAADYVATPLDREIDLPILELHANMLDTLIRNSAPVQAPIFWDYLFTLMISTMTIFVVLALKPVKGILILIGSTFSFILLCILMFAFAGVWIPMAHALVTVFLCYYFLIPYRLILENRISWEYYQKNKLLREVEQLKTNFISMMSHDLKTPIARIQGMTDLIRKDRVVLSSAQLEAVDTIRASAADLLTFINSILNYARIESHGIVLHREPKDINQLIEEVIKRHDFMSKLKNMKIQRELEPLFSISVDPDLIRQVFSNLLENALKYSPEGSTVTVTSKEIDDVLQIEFIDQGPGIDPEDMDFVFMKFFRSKEAKSSPIKGSGLGLYLSKYFIELHGGRVFVTSALGKGSVFTVQLPLKV